MPNWRRNKKGMLSLDTYADDLCIFRCIAVHRGAHCVYNTRQTQQRIVPKHNVGRDTLRQGGHRASAANARERRKVHLSSEWRQIVWLRRGGHRGAQRAVGEVRGNDAVIFNKPTPSEAVPQHIKSYLACSKCKPMHDLCSFSPATNPVVCTDAALMCCKKVSRGS